MTCQLGGIGLGLDIGQKLVALLGGHLHLESRKQKAASKRAPAAGLPCACRWAIRRPSPAISATASNTCSGPAREAPTAGRRQDGNAGVGVHEAANGQITIELAHLPHNDMVLMDVQMPLQNGYQATAQLRRDLSLATPIAALTGKVIVGEAIVGEGAKCLAAGMNDYLTKPSEKVTLLKMVNKWVVGEYLSQTTPSGT